MSVRDIESFDGSSSRDAGGFTSYNGKWSGLLSHHADYAHDGGFGVRTNGSGESYAFGSTEQTAYVGLWHRNLVSLNNDAMIRVMDGATAHLTIGVTTTGQVRVWRGTEAGTVLGTSVSGGLLAVNTWAFVEVGFKIDDSTGFVEVRINGTTALGLSGIDTRNGGNAYATGLQICGADGVNTADFDSFYFVDNAGTPTTFLGSGAAVDLRPNGAGGSTQWTPSAGSNYQAVDEAGLLDSDTTYNASSTAAQKDTFEIEGVAVTGGSIAAVKLVTLARDTDGGTRNLADVINLGGGESQRSTRALTTSYACREEIFRTDPADSSALTEAKINAAQIGYTLIS